MYEAYQEVGGTRCYATIYNHFKDFWPHVRKIPQYSDYCSICFVSKKLINGSLSLDEKAEHEEALQEHLDQARSACENYKVVNIGRAKLLEGSELLCLSFDWA